MDFKDAIIPYIDVTKAMAPVINRLERLGQLAQGTTSYRSLILSVKSAYESFIGAMMVPKDHVGFGLGIHELCQVNGAKAYLFLMAMQNIKLANLVRLVPTTHQTNVGYVPDLALIKIQQFLHCVPAT
jgi:hypothetical protein